MSSLSIQEKESQQMLLLSDKKYFYIPSKSLFNSKLFIDLDINQEEINDPSETNTEEDSDCSNELEEMNYLSNELMKDLDSPISIETKEKEKNSSDNIKLNNNDNISTNINIINSLISLAKDGYEFKPKNYKPEKNKENENKSNNNNNSNKYGNKFIKRRDNKNDWICSYCNNLNFSFRNRCNKCKTSKENSDRFINYDYCVL